MLPADLQRPIKSHSTATTEGAGTDELSRQFNRASSIPQRKLTQMFGGRVNLNNYQKKSLDSLTWTGIWSLIYSDLRWHELRLAYRPQHFVEDINILRWTSQWRIKNRMSNTKRWYNLSNALDIFSYSDYIFVIFQLNISNIVSKRNELPVLLGSVLLNITDIPKLRVI